MSRRRTIVSVVGTRPNFMKIAPIAAAIAHRDDGCEHVLVHTGQHYDASMSDVFFAELGVGEPDHKLAVGAGSHAQTTARVIERLEPLLEQLRPDVVLVPGDVNSTLAAALVATKLGLVVGHVEAGLRSFDRTMPEELNRVVVDAVSDLLFTHSPEAQEHLQAEGRPAHRVHYVGNTMIDTLTAMRARIDGNPVVERLGLSEGGYLVVTLHRPGLVDGPLLRDAVAALREVAGELPVVFPVHPRTRARIEAEGLAPPADGPLRLLEPLGYLDFLALVARSRGVLTDSGGIQEETTFLGVPCLTLRDNTERPVTVELGTNVLLGLDPARIREAPTLIEQVRRRRTHVPPLWDGRASERIVDVLAAL
jgi:UDP-N-acetylglucosamine 2-epimerase (non-hydrolysing)